MARRLHDCGRSAVPVVLVATVCALSAGAGILLGIAASMPDYVSIAFHFAALWATAAGLVAIGGLALLFWAGLLSGDRGTNRFGPPEATPVNLKDLIMGRR
ncbi:DUF805 domain-containing protein [Sphingomonas psychrotolerans]|uniref:DUF805 domain-containing protein n=1 Tax=Sphingomonas psychrotolerans TaxID=1327635 RepID=A0ABU3N2J2_9SPHN|nr:DUF805 domain-containing protein [Sphingomonas psychrotolerans]